MADLVDDGVADLADGLAARLAERRIGPRKIAIWAGRLETIVARARRTDTPRKMPKSSSSSGVSVSS